MARVPVEAWRARHRELPVFLLEQIANLIRLCCLWLGLGCAFLLRRGFLRSHGILAHGKTMREAVHLLGFALLLGRAIRFGRAIPGLFTIHTSDWGHGSLGGTFRSAVIASNSPSAPCVTCGNSSRRRLVLRLSLWHHSLQRVWSPCRVRTVVQTTVKARLQLVEFLIKK